MEENTAVFHQAELGSTTAQHGHNTVKFMVNPLSRLSANTRLCSFINSAMEEFEEAIAAGAGGSVLSPLARQAISFPQ